jgi:hypothetical protein
MRRFCHHIATAMNSARQRLGVAISVSIALLSVMAALPAVSAASEPTCPNEALRAEDNSSALPDCRAYELVSPAYNEGYEFLPEALSPNGETLTGFTFGSVAGTEQNAGFSESDYSLTRGATGWGVHAIDPSAPAGNSCEGETSCFATVSADGTSSLWVTHSTAEPRDTIYRREPGGAYVAIGPIEPSGEAKVGADQIVGASADLSTVLFRGNLNPNIPHNKRFWPGDHTVSSTSTNSLYQYTGTADSAPVLVGVRGSEDSATSGSAQLISECGTELAAGQGQNAMNAVSVSGAVVFFTAKGGTCEGFVDKSEKGTGPAVNELWARIGGTESVAISEPTSAQCTECHTAHTTPAVEEKPAVFQGASEDGSKVFFTTEQELLPTAKGSNLYEYDFDAPAGQKVSLVSGGAQPSELDGVVQIAPDGARVYFAAGAVLATNKNAEGATAQAKAENLYVYDTAEKATRFVGTVWSEADATRAEAACSTLTSEAMISRCYDNIFLVDEGLWSSEGKHEAATTADGRFLAFISGAQLTADDTSIAPQAFEYDAATGELTRVSRGQGGSYNNDGNTLLAPAQIGRAGEGYERLTYSRPGDSLAGFTAISANGSEVVFASGAELTPGALNEDNLAGCEFEEEKECFAYAPAAYAPNFYEYHSEGGIDHGEVSLIDRASTAVESGAVAPLAKLYGIDPSGNDIFFSSTEPLVGQVADTEINLFDARVDGGFPAPHTPTGCSGDSCQGPLAAAPPLQSPLTATQPGGENLAPPSSKPEPKPKPKKPTQAQKLKRALQHCGKTYRKSKKKRMACIRKARYGKAKASSNSHHHNKRHRAREQRRHRHAGHGVKHSQHGKKRKG